MVITLVEDKNNFVEERITAQTFLSSINTWYEEEGIELGVEQIITKEVTGQYGEQNMFVVKCSILSDMPKCRARVLDNNGKVKQKQDDMGEMVDCIEVVDDADAVTFFIYLPFEKGLVRCSKFSASFQFIQPLFEMGGETIGDSSFTFDPDDFGETCEGLEFICKVDKNKNKRLIPVAESKKED